MSEPATHVNDPSVRLSIRSASPRELDVLSGIDDEASRLYAEYGLPIELEHNHRFVQAELARWKRAAELGRAFLATYQTGTPVGFSVLDMVDGEAYLDQLAVRLSAMRRGIGGRLLAHGTDWARAAGASAIWLTTYAHVPFNRPYYERHGYVVVPEAACGPGILHHLYEQRRYLPAPAQRVAMRRLLNDG